MQICQVLSPIYSMQASGHGSHAENPPPLPTSPAFMHLLFSTMCQINGTCSMMLAIGECQVVTMIPRNDLQAYFLIPACDL